MSIINNLYTVAMADGGGTSRSSISYTKILTVQETSTNSGSGGSGQNAYAGSVNASDYVTNNHVTIKLNPAQNLKGKLLTINFEASSTTTTGVTFDVYGFSLSGGSIQDGTLSSITAPASNVSANSYTKKFRIANNDVFSSTEELTLNMVAKTHSPYAKITIKSITVSD